MKPYKTMTDEALIEALQKGDLKIIDFLMEKYKYLVLKKTGELFLLGGDRDDLIQEGMIGLFRAIQDFDAKKKASFFSFADLCVERQMYSAIKAAGRKKHSPLNSYISIYEADTKPEERQVPLVDTMVADDSYNPERIFLENEFQKEVKEKMGGLLSPFEQKVFYLQRKGVDYQTIAVLLGKTPKSIDNALQRIKKKASSIYNTQKCIDKSLVIIVY